MPVATVPLMRSIITPVSFFIDRPTSTPKPRLIVVPPPSLSIPTGRRTVSKSRPMLTATLSLAPLVVEVQLGAGLVDQRQAADPLEDRAEVDVLRPDQRDVERAAAAQRENAAGQDARQQRDLPL